MLQHTPRPHRSPRVEALLAEMTLEEKQAQLVGFWVDQGDEVVAPLSGEKKSSSRYDGASAHGIGHLTRVYGTRPVDPVERARWLWTEQARLQRETRLGIPAIVHEECLTGLAAWQAATYPTPLAWGASFDPDLVAEVGAAIGESMRALGIHQGLAPVLDVIRDPRWGRVDECIAEDPLVVGTIGTAYVRGLQSAGVHATLKHFIGYSASQAGRNHAPVHAGRREIEDVLMPPFEMALHEGGARSVMNSYVDIDGTPVTADAHYLTEVLRERWGFDGVVVSDYFAVDFLRSMHRVAADGADAARLAISAGIDVELPSPDAFLTLADQVRDGRLPESVLDLAVGRVLAQKEELGLLDADFSAPPEEIDLDSAAHRTLAGRLAEESIVLLSNDGILPLETSTTARIAVIGPNADSSEALMGCYSFVNHVLAHHPEVPAGIELPTVLDAVRAEFGRAEVTHALGCEVEGTDRSRIDEAVADAAAADLAIVVVGDRAGLFGRGTVGEGNDVESLELPGVQRALVDAVVATGTPVILVAMTGRPYAWDWALPPRDGAAGVAVGLGAVNSTTTASSSEVPSTDAASARRPAATLQAFFPGEEGAPALARLLSGRTTPSGRLPVSLPRAAGAQPYSYLHPLLGGLADVTSADPTPVRPFGFGLTYTTFAHDELTVALTAPTDEVLRVSVRVRNTGEMDGVDVVQLYVHDEVASATRPVAQLVGFRRVALAAGAEKTVDFEVPVDRLAFTAADGVRRVEPGRFRLWVGSACDDEETVAVLEIR
ncbi:beta-xylosidase/alpha-l-arabinosidase [Microbacterium hydrocarbonoxydans]|uniref:beta-xylosidase/alpha-l-arabinosidase n=1 Tax=Microbacterium hydrocarbonoxydans TaxID=273678 RepID=UPI00203A88F6|nr:glycoside hydrolase family 3 N-terminal domain-containing protein [Microbacterium hydrocarbonoxydans]MCM3779760.1 glycoside hydrolase family 3 C-terminal domain-containing protein [Microbacterium hydrocarbonoxydans]